MGNLNVTKLSRKKDKANYIHQLSKDIQALDYMLENDMIEKSPIRIGAEQEFCLVNDEFLLNNNPPQVLKEINDDHFTTEIGNYNPEANLDSFELTGDCFSKVHKQLKPLMDKAKSAAEKYNTKIILPGILSTLLLKHISIDNMTKMQ